MSGPGKFSGSIAEWIEKTRARVNTVATVAALELANRIKVRTPVDTGRLRAAWTIDELEHVVTARKLRVAADGTVSGGERVLTLPRQVLGQVVRIQNELPYARRIEYGFSGTDRLGRHYDQPGRAMVGRSVLEWPSIVAAADKAVR